MIYNLNTALNWAKRSCETVSTLKVKDSSLRLYINGNLISSILLPTNDTREFTIPTDYTTSVKSLNSWLGGELNLQLANKTLYPFVGITVSFIVPPFFNLSPYQFHRLKLVSNILGFKKYLMFIDESFYYSDCYHSELVFSTEEIKHPNDKGFLAYCSKVKV